MIEYSSYEKLCLRLPGRRTYIFWNSDILIFPTFEQLLSKFLRKKPPGFKLDFESTDKVLPLHQYLRSKIFWQWNNSPLNFFKNLYGRAFCFLNFVNEGNIEDSVLLILLKCIVMGYFNGNKSFAGRLFSNYEPLNMLFHFFSISHL